MLLKSRFRLKSLLSARGAIASNESSCAGGEFFALRLVALTKLPLKLKF